MEFASNIQNIPFSNKLLIDYIALPTVTNCICI